MDVCHGRRRCTVTADSATFGNPCRADSRVYLKVVYTCSEYITCWKKIINLKCTCIINCFNYKYLFCIFLSLTHVLYEQFHEKCWKNDLTIRMSRTSRITSTWTLIRMIYTMRINFTESQKPFHRLQSCIENFPNLFRKCPSLSRSVVAQIHRRCGHGMDINYKVKNYIIRVFGLAI